MTRGVHIINVVSPGLVMKLVDKYAHYFPGHNAVAMDRVVNGYVKSIEGEGNGQIIRVYN